MNQKDQSKVTLRRVAEVAGVSLGTASNVLARKPGVATSTRQSVLSIASELGYQPAHSISAGAPVVPPVTALGFVVRSLPHPLLANLFYSYVLHGEEEICRENGISLMYAAVDEDASSMEQLPAMLRQKQVQGLLVVGYFHPSFYTLLQSLDLPFVTVDHYLDSLQVDSVVNDDEQGAYIATNYLLERVQNPVPAIITDYHTHASIYHRWRGYCRALAEHHLPYDERYVLQGFPGNEFAYKGMKTLLQLDVPPNAVFCGGDVMAMETLKALQDSGVSVPDECAVIGFDDLPLASHTTPTLTTMKVDIELLGKEGTRSLLERIRHPEMATRRTVISVKLIERESVARQPLPAD